MRTYKLLTSDGVVVLLKQRIEELEQQHLMAALGLIAARAVVSVTPETATQRVTSEREAEQLERNVASLEAAINALIAQLAELEAKEHQSAHEAG